VIYKAGLFRSRGGSKAGILLLMAGLAISRSTLAAQQTSPPTSSQMAKL